MHKANSRTLLSWLSVVSAILAAAGLISLFGWDEYRNWRSERGRAEQVLLQASDGLGRYVDDTIQVARVALGDLVTEIRHESGNASRGFKVRKMMLGQLASIPQLEMMSAIDASGRLIAISANSPPSDIDFSRQDYFQHHSKSRDQSPYIAMPARSRLDGNWVLTVSRRLDDAKGNFAGVVVASFTTRYFADFFEGYGLTHDPAFVIARADGLVLSELPYDASRIGRMVTAERYFPSQPDRAGSSVSYYTSVDGEDRVSAFKQSPRTQVMVITTASFGSIFGLWARNEVFRWFIFAAVAGLSGFALSGWVVQSRRRMKSEEQMAVREAEFRLLAEASVDLIQRLDQSGKRLYVSPASLPLFGIPPADLVGRNFVEGLERASARTVTLALARLKRGSEIEKVVTLRRLADGRSVWVETTFRRINDGAGTSIVSVSRDITAHKLQSYQLEEMANTDQLTGLSNRRAFDSLFTRLIGEAQRKKKPLSLLMVDVDRFKQYNDLYGHGAGDECLKAVAQALRSSLRETCDFAFRYGGEEFAVLLTNADPDCAMACAERMRASVEGLALEHSGHPPARLVTASVGAATLADDEKLGDLLARADAALYDAKRSGRNRTSFGMIDLPERTVRGRR